MYYVKIYRKKSGSRTGLYFLKIKFCSENAVTLHEFTSKFCHIMHNEKILYKIENFFTENFGSLKSGNSTKNPLFFRKNRARITAGTSAFFHPHPYAPGWRIMN